MGESKDGVTGEEKKEVVENEWVEQKKEGKVVSSGGVKDMRGISGWRLGGWTVEGEWHSKEDGSEGEEEKRTVETEEEQGKKKERRLV